MKVLHINTGQTGGASICAMRISNALKQQGVESRLLVQSGESHDDITVAEKDRPFLNRNGFLIKLKHLLTRLGLYEDEDSLWYERNKAMPNANDVVYTNVPLTSYKNIAHHPLVEWADVIHMHWVACFVDYPTFFKEVKKPIVWTLHDHYPAIGIMHFCSEHSPLPQQLVEFDRKCLDIKKKALMKRLADYRDRGVKEAGVFPVAISDMMSGIIGRSELLGGFPCTLIHNGVDTTVFKDDSDETKDHSTITFLFSSYGLWVERKGLGRVIEALEKVQEEFQRANVSKVSGVSEFQGVEKPETLKLKLICVGDNEGTKPVSEKIEIIETGLVGDNTEMSHLYSQADFYIQASYHEAFSQTNLEAMSCGTPVISTPCSGSADLIRPFNGVLCDGFEVEDLINGIKNALSQKFDRKAIRDYIIENYDYPVIARKYIELYKKVMNE